MRKFAAGVALVALLVGVAGVSTPSRAETGQVAVVFTKGGLIVGVGGGEGVLVLRGKRYPFTVSGMSVGFTIGASTTKLVGRALNLRGPASIEGSYSAIGAGGAVAAGAGGVQLQNANGVILQLSGGRSNDTLEIGIRRQAARQRGLPPSISLRHIRNPARWALVVIAPLAGSFWQADLLTRHAPEGYGFQDMRDTV